MKRTVFALLLAAVAAAAMAIPAKRATRTVSINGKAVNLTLVGNENLHYWRADDGTAYQLDEGLRAEAFDLRAARAGMTVRKTMQMERAEAMAATAGGMRKMSQMNRTKYSGERRGLVILAQFTDKRFTIANTQATYADVMGKRGYSGNGQFGSVRDYFYAQSYGEFDFVLDVVGPVTLSHNMAYYGANDSNGNDVRPAHMAKEACQLADAKGVDFTQYDWDNDGFVEQVFIIYAGYGEAQGASSSTIWPHAWSIEATGSTLTLDGKRISSYACGSELSGASGSKMDGIGTVCHEFSHCFGLPDFYCTDYNHDELAMAYWSVMDHGSYSNGGYCPAAYTAYERWACGWLEPTVLDEPATIHDMPDINDTPQAYILYNQGNRNEYYIMYNVQNTGWNTYAYGHGMLVLHVDYSSSAWGSNSPNNDASHLRMTPICADNNRTTSAYSLAGDPYPGVRKNTSLTDASTPAATLFNANANGRRYMGKPIENIAETDGKISFVFDGGYPRAAVPKNLRSEVDGNGFTALWDEAANATRYDVEYGEYDQELVAKARWFVDETFDFGISSDGTADISGLLDTYTSAQGFTGSKLYKGRSGLRLGSSSAKGYIDTPALYFDCDQVEVTLTVSPYTLNLGGTSASTTSVTCVRIDQNGKTMESGQRFSVTSNSQTFKATLSTKGMRKIRIGAPDARLYLKSIAVRAVPKPYGEGRLVEGLTATSAAIAPEPPADAYYFRVRAYNANDEASEWSDREVVIINEWHEPDAIHGTLRTPAPSATYDLSGRRVKTGKAKGLFITDGKKQIAPTP